MKILIVDDELIIRRGLKNKIERLFSNITEVIIAEDAFQGLEIIATERPDVVITDIRMPEMDGLTFIERAKKIRSDTKFVIISGYQEFEYAKEAIKLSVEDYLVKPIENEKLRGVISRIYDQFLQENKKKNQLYELKTTMKQSMSFLRSKHLTDFILESHSYDKASFQKLLEKVEVRFPFPCYTIISIELNENIQVPNFPFKEDLLLVKFIINNIAEEIFNGIGRCVAFEDNKNNNLIHLLFNHAEFLDGSVNDIIFEHCNKLLFEVHNCIKVYVTIGIGSKVNDFQKIKVSYVDADRVLKQKFSKYNTKVFAYGENFASPKQLYMLSHEQERLLIQFVKNGFSKEAKQIIVDIFEDIERKGIEYGNLVMIYMEIMLLIIKSIKEHTGCLDDILSKDILTENYVNVFSNINQLREGILTHIDIVCNYLEDIWKSDGQKIIERIKTYIEQNYYMDISLTQFSEQYFLNNSYLSQLFKKETGTGFSEYLTNIRMQEAKKLLDHTNIKVTDISQMVGYNGTKYFLRAFQRHCGCTPTQYRVRSIV